VQTLIERARMGALAYAQADPHHPSDTLGRLRAIAAPGLVRRIAQLLRQDAEVGGAEPAPVAHLVHVRLVALEAGSARVLVVIERRQGRRVGRQVLEVGVNRMSGRVAGLASL